MMLLVHKFLVSWDFKATYSHEECKEIIVGLGFECIAVNKLLDGSKNKDENTYDIMCQSMQLHINSYLLHGLLQIPCIAIEIRKTCIMEDRQRQFER